jgi:hypothetical protein
VVVDRDLAAAAGGHAYGLQAEPGGGRLAPGAEDHHVGLGLGAVVEGDDRPAGGGPGPGGGVPGMDGDPVGGQRVAGQLADPGVLPVDQPAGPLDDGDLRAHPGVELAEFDADRAAADQQHAAGDVSHAGGLPVRPHRHPVQAVDVRPYRHGPGGDHDVIGLEEFPARLDLAGTGDPGGALDHGGALFLVAADLGGVIEMADHVVVVVPQLRPVQRGGGHPRGPGRLRPRLRGAQQRLGRDARPVSALAADQLPLDHRHPSPVGQQPPGSGLPAHAHPDNDHVEPVHCCLPITARTSVARSGLSRPAWTLMV